MDKGSYKTISSEFDARTNEVERLMNFDRDLLDVAIQSVTALRERLKQHHALDNPSLTAEKTLEQLNSFRLNDSLRPRYETIFNQALVLLVSYFGSAIHDLFAIGIQRAIDRGTDTTISAEEFKFSVKQLREMDFDVSKSIPELLISSKDISFQDMQSIKRAFQKYLEIVIQKDEDVNNIIIGQACRHVVVHAGGRVSERMLRQIEQASPRRVKVDIQLGQQIQFSESEINLIAKSMKTYVSSIVSSLEKRH